MARWVYRVSDGWISHRCQYSDAVKTGDFATIDLPDDQAVDRDREVVDAGVVRQMTELEVQARATLQRQRAQQTESRREDVLTTLAWAIRRGNPAAFDALSGAEKRALVLQQAEVWRTLRELFEPEGGVAAAGRV